MGRAPGGQRSQAERQGNRASSTEERGGGNNHRLRKVNHKTLTVFRADSTGLH